MNSFSQVFPCSRPSRLPSPVHEQGQSQPCDNGEIMNNYRTSALHQHTSSSFHASKPQPHIQTFFSSSYTPQNSDHFSAASAPSPFSSASSGSYPNDSPPAEPPFEMEPDYLPGITQPDDLHYSYPAVHDNHDPARWPPSTVPSSYHAYEETVMPQPIAAPLPMSAAQTMPVPWVSGPIEKYQPQRQYQQWEQQQHANSYPSFSTQVGRMRSSSGDAPSAHLNRDISLNSRYTVQQRHMFPLLSEEKLDLVHPSEPEIAPLVPSSMVTSGHTPFSLSLSPTHSHGHMRSYSQEYAQAPQTSQAQAAHAKRERERSMSDAAAYQMRIPRSSNGYPASSVAASGAYAPYNTGIHGSDLNAHSYISNQQSHSEHPPSSSPSHTGYSQQYQDSSRHSVSMPMPMSAPLYGSQPIYHFNGQQQTSSSSTAGPYTGSGAHRDARTSEESELSPVMRYQQMEAQGTQGLRDPRYVNNGMSGDCGASSAVKEEDKDDMEDETIIARQLATLREPNCDSEFFDAEGDEDAEGEEYGGEYDHSGDDDADDSEYEIQTRISSTTGNSPSRSLRPRRRTSTATKSSRYEPYAISSSSSRSSSRAAPASSHSPTALSNSRARSRGLNSLGSPVPIPNLTKKSRGRRVPTVDSLSGKAGRGPVRQDGDDEDGKNARTYTCDAVGCGKCFARGEHLKRHVRSIHTYEKRRLFSFLSCFMYT